MTEQLDPSTRISAAMLHLDAVLREQGMTLAYISVDGFHPKNAAWVPSADDPERLIWMTSLGRFSRRCFQFASMVHRGTERLKARRRT